MNQTISWASFATGFTGFIGVGTEIISQHKTFADFKTPMGVFHLFALGGLFILMVGGALNAQLPRASSHEERVTDQKLSELNKDGKS